MNNVVPIKSMPNQTFTITLFIDNKNITYTVNAVYRDKLKYWTIDVTDYDTNVMLLSNVPLLSFGTDEAYFDILNQLKHKKLGTMYIIKNTDIKQDNPEYSTIENDFTVVWGDNK